MAVGEAKTVIDLSPRSCKSGSVRETKPFCCRLWTTMEQAVYGITIKKSESAYPVKAPGPLASSLRRIWCHIVRISCKVI